MKQLKVKTGWVETGKPEDDEPGCPWCGRDDEISAREVLKKLVDPYRSWHKHDRFVLSDAIEQHHYSATVSLDDIRKAIGDV